MKKILFIALVPFILAGCATTGSVGSRNMPTVEKTEIPGYRFRYVEYRNADKEPALSGQVFSSGGFARSANLHVDVTAYRANGDVVSEQSVQLSGHRMSSPKHARRFPLRFRANLGPEFESASKIHLILHTEKHAN